MIDMLAQPALASIWLWQYPGEAPSAVSTFSQHFASYFDSSFFDLIPNDITERSPKYMARIYQWEGEEFKFERYQTNAHIVLMVFWLQPHKGHPASRPPTYRYALQVPCTRLFISNPQTR